MQYGEQAAIGKLNRATNGATDEATNGSATAQATTLWWQAPQHQVQFRSSQDDRAKAGLLPYFRANAISSLLPVLPNLPLPTITKGTFDQPSLLLNGKTNSWQPVLPASLRYLLLGARSGAMFAIRNQLLRQSGIKPEETTAGESLVSGSIPVQHRIPRPVPLPPNQDKKSESALQTWASYFEPTANHLGTDAPADEAFFAASSTTPTRRLQMTIANLKHGEIPINWDGTLIFVVKPELKLSKTKPDWAINWEMQLSLEVNGTIFPFESPTPVPQPSENQKPTQPDSDQANPDQDPKPLEKWEFKSKTVEDLLKQISTLVSGSIVTAKVRVQPRNDSDRFFQMLTFPLRIVSNTDLPLPLEPHFILFEDPEYNRRLASSTANASRIVQVQNNPALTRTVTLACERHEYNPDSQVFFRFDWDDDLKTDDRKAKLQVFQLTEGIAKRLPLPSDDTPIEPGKLQTISLEEFQTENKLHLQLVLQL